MARTRSAWGKPDGSFYRFLKRAEDSAGTLPTLHVIGCADGKFVLPPARRGWTVHAVDKDTRMLYGCSPDPSIGIREAVPGLADRLSCEELEKQVILHTGDFMTATLPRADALWTSGCLQYSANRKYGIMEMTSRLRSTLKTGGLAFFEYMLPTERKLMDRPNCPPSSWWVEAFPKLGWEIVSHVTLHNRSEPAHPYLPKPHSHSWGRMLARRA